MIFISYRRADAGGHAGRLFDRFSHWFDADALFYDLDGIDAGDVFPARIQTAIENAAVILVLIGPDWLEEINTRVSRPGVDFVRHEVELALARQAQGALVLPVLLGGADMPAPHALHADLQASLSPFCVLDAHEFRGKQVDWESHFVRLRERIAQVPGVPTPRFRYPADKEQPFRIIEHALSPHFQDPNGLLSRLCEQLAASGSAAVLARAALYGMGGVGKTQLALKYSHEYRDLYAGVWWFRAESDATVQLDALDCCKMAGAPVGEGELPSVALKHWLSGQQAVWLLVYDNAEEVAVVRPHLPDGGRHHVIITSRNPAWGGLAQPVELEVWTPQQGAEFLAGRLSSKVSEDLRELSEDLGGLPLALEQAASYLEETGVSVEAYRVLLAGIVTEGLILDEGRAATGYEHSVAATLSLAFARLSPAAARLLRLCAFAAPEALPERFFREAADSMADDLAAAAVDPLAWNRVAGELRRYGLAERLDIPVLDREPGESTERTESALVLHRLTQQVVRARLAQPDEDARLLQAVIRAACPSEANLPRHWPRYAALSEHVKYLDRFVERGWLDTRRHAWLLDRLASYLERGPVLFVEAVRWFRRAWEIDLQELGEEHPATLIGMNNLAGTLRAQGDLAGARVLQKKVLEVRRRVLGEEHPATLTSMGNLASTLWNQGDLAGARALEEKVLEVLRRVLGEEHPDTLNSMGNLASTLWKQGDLAGARALEEKVLEVRRRVIGEEHPNTLTSMNNLAGTLWNQGDLAGARALQEMALEVRRRVLGEEHPDTLKSMNNLAATLGAQGDLPGARALHEKELAVLRLVLGEEHPDVTGSAWNLFTILWNMQDTERAGQIFEQHLRWLIDCQPASLSADQRQIREMLIKNVDLSETGLEP